MSGHQRVTVGRRLAAEAVGSAFLLAAVVGSGIMGERLSSGNAAVALLANTLATGAALVALILTFRPISGAHFNPVVTLADASQGGIAWFEVPGYVAAQVVGAFAGVAAANVMFELPIFFASTRARHGAAQMFSEFVATFGLLAVIWGCARFRSTAVPFAVAAYITAAYWFTASTSFANPAVTLARAASDTFAGIRPADVPGFVIAQIIGAATATVFFRWICCSGDQEAAMTEGGPYRDAARRARILFLCTHNSARSQMAEGFLRSLAGSRFDVASAGTEATRVHPLAIKAMDEVGIDISRNTSKTVDGFLGQPWDYVITVCDAANEACPVFPKKTSRLHWSFPDPSQAVGTEASRLAVFRSVRDSIRDRLRLWIAEQDRASA